MYKVLLVEDNEILSEVLKDTLEEAGHAVDVAENGREALSMLDDSHQVVVTDIIMPELDGIELVRNLKSQNFRGKIIAMSGDSVDSDIYLESIKIFGVDGVIEKPQICHEINALIEKIMS